MIEVKTAVKIAYDFFKELYDTRKFEDILLEEVELSEDKTIWMVTLGFYRQTPSVNIMESIGSKKYIRAYKNTSNRRRKRGHGCHEELQPGGGLMPYGHLYR
jgi:hypothetical protein